MSDTSTTRRVTAADIARSLGISRATVGFVLNDTPGQTISEGTRLRVIEEAKRLGYRPHSAARALASGRTHLILMVLPDWPLDFTLRRNIEEASLALDEAGYSLITYTPHPTGAARPLWETLEPDVVMSLTGFAPDQVASIRAAGISAIIPDPDASEDRAYVEDGPRLQAEHLVALGHRRIAFAGSRDPRIADLVSTRRATFQRAAAGLGIEPVLTADFDYADAAVPELIAHWRDAGVTAVAAYNDDIAATTLGAALRLGLRVPDELAVIGYDDTPLATMIEPQLSTVRIDTAGLGRFSAALAISAATGRPAPEVGPEFTSELIVRASTRAPTNGGPVH
ncbi:DNA-binding LacI/PurR family transcriptional regulator [Agromyces sp. 3263]|uniref:LacI family DNA-binding transcriptional regulator n=1 Tax=Agromyces sp. 3263 TaxID=2817750 RepID=UPI002854951B|nr:LacI family DNA-binding transcriptional regulator [Agromyces sp. 3263]MDR6907160.1 DNA-binding LacI/PurR family transcriptional regulator [Agromyces sp. 3263]